VNTRSFGPCELEEISQQFVEPVRLGLDDLETVRDIFRRAVAALENTRGSQNAREGITDFMGKARRELSGGVEALGFLHLPDVVLQLPVHALQFTLLRTCAIGESPGYRAGRAKDGHLEDLIVSVGIGEIPDLHQMRRVR